MLRWAVRVAKGQKSPVLKEPVSELRRKETVIPFSRMIAAPEVGVGISPVLPAAPRSVMSVVPSLAKTLPAWSQRRMQGGRLGVGWCGASARGGRGVAFWAGGVVVLACA